MKLTYANVERRVYGVRKKSYGTGRPLSSVLRYNSSQGGQILFKIGDKTLLISLSRELMSMHIKDSSPDMFQFIFQDFHLLHWIHGCQTRFFAYFHIYGPLLIHNVALAESKQMKDFERVHVGLFNRKSLRRFSLLE